MFLCSYNTSMYCHTLYRDKKHFYCYYLQPFSTEEIPKSHINDTFKINDKRKIQMAEENECAKFKNYERKIKSPFMIYVDLENVLVAEDNKKQYPGESYTNKSYIKSYIKNMLVINLCVLMVNLVNLLNLS